MNSISKSCIALILSFAIADVAFAQTPAPVAPAAPSAAAPTKTAPGKPAAMTAADKAALSKKCSADANAQNLHGKARKTFRDKCKKGTM